MNRTIGRAALVSLLLGTATIGCTPSAHVGHIAALSDTAAGAKVAARAAAKARAALAAHNPAAAIHWAERAVAASPNDADDRMLLGQAYLAAGRFASAEASFRDTLALVPDQPRAGFDLALVQIAQGLPAEGRVTLAAVRGRVPDSDVGLAMALAGDRNAGIAMLTDLVRAGQSDARARQNLALALALDGRWSQARGLAMQDTPPDRIDAKIAGWAAMAKAGGAQQVATMLGTAPAIADPGRPPRLALAAPSPAAPVALALAAPAAPPAPVAIAAAAPVPAVSIPLEAPAAPVPAGVAVAMAVPVPVRTVAAALVPARLAPVAPGATVAAVESPRFVRVAAVQPAMRMPPAASVAPGHILRPVERGGFVVQLGAYARSTALDAAWTAASRLSPRVATFIPVQGRTQRRGATLMRLSIGGFATRDEAAGLCRQVKARGGSCFVRATIGDRPMQWARKDAGEQVAMR